jgi:hypothetical protein
MKHAVFAFALILPAPVLAADPPEEVSEAGTAFIRHCLADVTASRVVQLKERAAEFAATLSEEQLVQGAMNKAQRACPCFLHVIGVSAVSEGDTPEEKAAGVVAYLDAIHAGESATMPPVLGTITRNCGERSSVMPVLWLGD